MKCSLAVLAVAAALLAAMSFPGARAAGTTEVEVQWDRALGGGKDDFAFAIAAMTDGGLALAGWTESAGAGGADAWVVRLDAKGGRLWEQVIGRDGEDSANAIAAYRNGGLAIGGHTSTRAAYKLDGWVVRFDADGKRLWDRVFDRGDGLSVTAVSVKADGGLVAVGSIWRARYARADAWIAGLGPDGSLLWERTSAEGGSHYVRAVSALADGGIVVAGQSEFSMGTGRKAWVMRLDAAGQQLWRRTFESGKDASARALAVLADGGFALAGFTGTEEAGVSDAWVAKVDANGDLVWDRAFPLGGFGSVDAIAAPEGGGVAVVGFAHNPRSGISNAWVLRLDAWGGHMWQRNFGGGNNDFARTVVPMPDGRLVLAGWTGSKGAGMFDAWVLSLRERTASGPRLAVP